MRDLGSLESHPYREPPLRDTNPPRPLTRPARRRTTRWSWVIAGVAAHVGLRALFGPMLESAPTSLYLVLLTIVLAPLLMAELIVLRG